VPIKTGSVVKSKIIGMLVTKDERGTDDKLITVPDLETDPVLTKIKNVEDLDKQTLDSIQYFYKNYKIIEPGKWVDIDGYFSKDKAVSTLSEAVKRYHQHFLK